MLPRLRLLVLLLLLAPRFAPAQGTPPASLPNTPAAKHVAAFLQMSAASSEETIRSFIDAHFDPSLRDAYPMEQHLATFQRMRQRFGALTLVGYRQVTPTQGKLTVQGGAGSGTRVYDLEFAAEPPHRIVSLQGRPSQMPRPGAAAEAAPAMAADRTIAPAVRSAVVESVAAAMERHHLFPDTGQMIARRLREQARAGAYDAAATAKQLAVALTDDIHAVNPDRHVNVRATSDSPGQAASGGPGGGRQVGSVERLPGNVGYVQITGPMSPSDAARAEATEAFRTLRDTEAMIIDLRGVPGGSGELANFLVSHFLPAGTHTITRVTPAQNDTTQVYTLQTVPGPRRTDVPLYVLVDRRSASAAEHVPFVLQNLGRAKLVGERTPGAGRNNRFVDVGNGFTVSVSFTRVTDPRTGKEWERVGIQPDIPTSSADALRAAHRAALEGLLAKARDPKTRAELQRALAEVLAAPAPAAAPGSTAEFTTLLERIRGQHGLPALAAALVRGDAIVASGATGVRRVSEPAPVALSDRFFIGSLTKEITGTLLGTLIDQGKVRWETTLGELFPELRDTMTPVFRDATVEQVLRHRAGLPTLTRLGPEHARLLQGITGTPTEQRAQFAAWLLRQEPVAAPGSSMNYSNAGYALAGAIAERIAGRAWEELVQERVFAPLAIRSAAFGAPAQIEPGQPWGHVGANGTYTPAPGHGPSSPVMRPAGGVSMTIEDLARFAAAHMAEQNGAGKLLRPETARRLYDDKPTTLAGGNGMHTAMMDLRPREGLAVVVATNSGGEQALEEAIRTLREANSATAGR